MSAPRYRVIRPTGDYYPRQAWARDLGADLYIEVHLNASDDPSVDGAYCIVPLAPTPESLALGHELAQAAVEVCPHGRLLFNGVQQGVKGWANVDPERTGCPSVLWEPCFVSKPQTAAWLWKGDGIERLGRALASTVRKASPVGGVIALSAGHYGRPLHPDDRGAPLAGFFDLYEAHAALLIANKAEQVLRGWA